MQSYEEGDKAIILDLNRNINQEDASKVSKEYDGIIEENILQSPLGDQYIKRLSKVIRGEDSRECLFCGKPSREKTMICEECWSQNAGVYAQNEQKLVVDRITQKMVPVRTNVVTYTEPKKSNPKIFIICGLVLVLALIIAVVVPKVIASQKLEVNIIDGKVDEINFAHKYGLLIQKESKDLVGEKLEIEMIFDGLYGGADQYKIVINGQDSGGRVVVFTNDDGYVRGAVLYAEQENDYMYTFRYCLLELTCSDLTDVQIEDLIRFDTEGDPTVHQGEPYCFYNEENFAMAYGSRYFPEMLKLMGDAFVDSMMQEYNITN